LPHALGRLALGLGQDARFAGLRGNAYHQETGLKVKKFMLCKFAKMSNGYACKKIWTPRDIEQEISSIMQFLWRLAHHHHHIFSNFPQDTVAILKLHVIDDKTYGIRQ
jgi:hypothetical protein